MLSRAGSLICCWMLNYSTGSCLIRAAVRARSLRYAWSGAFRRGSDIVNRGFGEVRDVFTITEPVDNIISNIPFKIAEPCARHLLNLARRKVALILPMTFWESRGRHGFFEEHPPIRYWPCSDRPSMPPGQVEGQRDRWGAVIQLESRGGTMPYGWSRIYRRHRR